MVSVQDIRSFVDAGLPAYVVTILRVRGNPHLPCPSLFMDE